MDRTPEPPRQASEWGPNSLGRALRQATPMHPGSRYKRKGPRDPH
jgi:hypothetical protein